MKYTETEQAVIELGGVWPGSDVVSYPVLGRRKYGSWCCWKNKYYLAKSLGTQYICTYSEFMEARARLENKPGWDDAPEWAGWLAQDSDGRWFWSEKSPQRFDHSPDNEWDCSVSGKFLWATNEGVCFTDWRESLEHRPEPTSNPQWVPGEELRNKYMREIKPGVWVDVYDVLHAWCVQNPALQHLIKKALQPGERGHKTMEQDMNDIVASALRARELGK